jgi:dihydrofolate reductase
MTSVEMRPVVVQMGVTLDGFGHGAKGYEDWGLPPEDDGVVAWKAASLGEAGTHIMGRRTYEAMASVWPGESGVYADVMNEIPKVVFSSTLTRAEWPVSSIASGGLADEIDRLRREPGGIILAHGGKTFLDALIGAGLVDEYRLVIHPVAIGHGAGLFEVLPAPLRSSSSRPAPSRPAPPSTPTVPWSCGDEDHPPWSARRRRRSIHRLLSRCWPSSRPVASTSRSRPHPDRDRPVAARPPRGFTEADFPT